MIKENNKRITITLQETNIIKLNFLRKHFKTKTDSIEINRLISFMYDLVNGNYNRRLDEDGERMRGVCYDGPLPRALQELKMQWEQQK